MNIFSKCTYICKTYTPLHISQYIQELPGKAFGKQLSILAKDDGIFEPDFIEERRQGLEEFINSVAGHPLVQNEKCLHSFLQEKNLDKEGYVPGKIGQ